MNTWSSRKLSRDLFAGLANHLALIVAGLATTPLIARLLGAEALGAWAVLGTLSFLLRLSDLGLTTVVQRHAVADDPPSTRRIHGLCLASISIITPLLIAISYFSLQQWRGVPAPLAAEMPAASAVALFAGGLGAYLAPFRGFVLARGGMEALAKTRIVSATSQVAATAIGLLLVRSLVVPAVALAISQLCELVLTVTVARAFDRELPLGPRRVSVAELRPALRDGSATLAINVAVAAAIRLDVLILSHVASLAAIGAYSVASRVVDQVLTLLKQFGAAMLPRLGQRSDRERALRLTTHLMGVLTASGLVALSASGQMLLVAWAGPVARSGVTTVALGLLGAAAACVAVTEPASAMLTMGARSVWHAALPIIVGSIVNVVVSIAGAARLGPWAVAGGTLVGNAITATLVWTRARHLVGWTRRRVITALLPSGAAALATFLVSTTLHRLAHSAAGSLLAVTLAGIAGIVAGWMAAHRLAARAVS